MIDVIKKTMLLGVGLAAMTKDKVEEYARDLADNVCELVTPNLRGVSRWINPEDPEDPQPVTLEPRHRARKAARSQPVHLGFRSDFRYQALIEVIYWHLADTLTGRRIRRCKAQGCGGLFAQTDPRQLYCPPPIGVRGKSRCAERERKRRQRKTNQKPKAAKAKRTRRR